MNDHEEEWEGEDDFDDYFEDIWDASIDPPDWVIENILPTGICFMVAPPKTFKSTIEMAWTLAVAGELCDALPPELRTVPEGGDGIVIGASAEATPGELRYMVEQGMGVKEGKHGRIRLLRDPWQWRLDDPGAVTRLIAKLEQVKPRLFWLDPLVDFHSLDEVDAGEMNRLLRPLQRWAKRNRACFLVVHHTRKRSGQDADRNLTADDARGTSAMFGLADGLIALTPKGKNRVHFHVTLKRGQPFEKTVTLKVWGEGEATVQIDGNAKLVYEYMLRFPEASQASIAADTTLSQSTVSRAVSQLKSMGAVDKDGFAVESQREAVRAATKTMQKERANEHSYVSGDPRRDGERPVSSVAADEGRDDRRSGAGSGADSGDVHAVPWAADRHHARGVDAGGAAAGRPAGVQHARRPRRDRRRRGDAEDSRQAGPDGGPGVVVPAGRGERMKSEHVTTVLVFLAIAFLQFLMLALAAALLDIPGVTAARLCGGAIVLHLAALTVKKAGE